MKQQRLEQLADGIFSIVMTLLVLDIRLPIGEATTDMGLGILFHQLAPSFASFFLSFSVLFTYWRAHHSIASVYVKNIDNKFTMINSVFLLLVALVPFSSHLLAHYHSLQSAVTIFSLHTILIGLVIFWMRFYAAKSDAIENEAVGVIESRHSYARILFPVFCAILAIFISFFDLQFALIFLTLGILFNFSKQSTRLIFRILNPFLTVKEI